MPLLTREIELIIIARDNASAVTARVGGALALLGGGMVALSKKAADVFSDMTMEAIDFSSDAALAFTQMADRGETSLEDIKDIMKRVAKEVPAAFEEMPEALFDIFSSMDASAVEAEAILNKVSQAAVAGQTDIRSAMIPTIAMMNAWQLGAEDIDHILDIQFETVRKGIVTYEEFTASVGQTIPAAKAAGQEIETMGAVIAFLTRNGLNASMAATSAARAFELFASPKAVKNLQKMGIEVTDAEGNFRQINEVLADMSVLFDGLGEADRKKLFIDIFGQGRIQARRFFDIAIPNWQELNSLVDVFADSSGAMQDAYNIMFEQPKQQLQLFTNRWQIIRTEIGDRFIPVLTERLIPAITQVFDWWDSLDSTMKDNLVRWASLGVIILGVVGTLTAIVGAGMLIVGLFGGIGAAVSAIATGFAVVTGIGAALAAVGLLVWKNWDRIKEVLPIIVERFMDIVNVVRDAVISIVDKARARWKEFQKTVLGLFAKFRPSLEQIGEVMQAVLAGAPAFFAEKWEQIKEIVKAAANLISAIIEIAFDSIEAVIRFTLNTIDFLWRNWGETITATISAIWMVIKTVISVALDVIENTIKFWTAVLTGDWEAAWNALVEIGRAVWLLITTFLEAQLQVIIAFFVEAWNKIRGNVEGAQISIRDRILSIWNGIRTFFSNIWNSIKKTAKRIWESDLVQLFLNVLGTMKEIVRINILFMWNVITTTFRVIRDNAINIWNAIRSAITVVWEFLKNHASTIWNIIKERILGPMRIVLTVIAGVALAIWSVLRTWWELIKRTAENMWAAIKGAAVVAWNAVKRAIIDPIIEAWRGVRDWLSNIIDAFAGFIGRLNDKVASVRNALSKIDPREWFSPPITVTVAAGMEVLKSVVTSGLMDLESRAATLVTNFRNTVDTMKDLLTDLANAIIDAGGSSGGGGGGGGGGTLPTVPDHDTTGGGVIQIIAQGADAASIAEEISWRLRTV